MELSHTLTAVVMSEVDSPQLTENAVYGGFWADCGMMKGNQFSPTSGFASGVVEFVTRDLAHPKFSNPRQKTCLITGDFRVFARALLDGPA